MASLQSRLNLLIAAVKGETKNLRTFISGSATGNTSGLNTAASNVVGAINEVKAAADSINDTSIVVSDNVNNNVSTSAHGWAPKLSGVSTQFLNGSGVYTVPAGGGDITAATYDPTGVAGDMFDMDNMAEGTLTKILTATERTAISTNSAKVTYPSADSAKVGFITITGAVNLDTLASDVTALANGMVYKDDWDASVGTFPGAGAAQTGWFYNVSVAGTVGGVAFSVGDSVIAKTDNASTTVYATNWVKKDGTDAVYTVAGRTGSVVIAAADIADFQAQVSTNTTLAAKSNTADIYTRTQLGDPDTDLVALWDAA